MQARRITESEVKRTAELFSIAFEFGFDESKSNDEMIKAMKESPRGRGDRHFLDKFAAFDDNNDMMGWLAATPYDVQFDGHVVKMTGIGGVSTLPQYRRNGVIRACFDVSLNAAYDDGYVLSYLYPFSTAYYRQFGYELCGETTCYSVDLRSIKRFAEADGSIHLVEHGSYFEDIKQVYNKFAEGYNLMCERKDFDYMSVTESNPAKDKHYIYVYKDKNDVAKGVMSFEKVEEDGRYNMHTRMFYFSDMEGFKGLMNHTLAFASYYGSVVFTLPMDINLTSYFPEWSLYPYKRDNYFHGMVRVVNVKEALMLARYQGSGELTIKVTDNQLSQNNRIFKVCFAKNIAISCDIIEAKPDIELNISDFSRLLIGTHSPNELKYVDTVKIHCGLEQVAKVFYKKPNYIADHF